MLAAALLVAGCNSAPAGIEGLRLPAEGATLVIPPGGCRPKIAGVSVTLDELEAVVRGQPAVPITFMPDPHADYGCVDRVLAALKRAGARGLGFVGNEEY